MPYSLALALTLLVEVPLYTAALAALGPVRPGRAALAAVAVNCATHPPLWWFLGRFTAGAPAAYWTAFVLAEAAVCLVEAVLLRVSAGPVRGAGLRRGGVRGAGPRRGGVRAVAGGGEGVDGTDRASHRLPPAVVLAVSGTANAASVLAGLLMTATSVS
ncbi:hypothetical protein [Kitasatospora camelliae]|uniref:Uncharacterized protein n=1 Tax=Kitasatospora camelliae TaxID=3156397 RepID=A0AAU8JWW0_9ACTN